MRCPACSRHEFHLYPDPARGGDHYKCACGRWLSGAEEGAYRREVAEAQEQPQPVSTTQAVGTCTCCGKVGPGSPVSATGSWICEGCAWAPVRR